MLWENKSLRNYSVCGHAVIARSASDVAIHAFQFFHYITR